MHRCLICGYIYNEEEGDPSHNIEPNTSFEDLPDDWLCPVCSVTRSLGDRLSIANAAASKSLMSLTAGMENSSEMPALLICQGKLVTFVCWATMGPAIAKQAAAG